ncbi:hypothetical protein AB0F88_01565 [Streptosporangium sp. NPDC023963]|uniref:hypothetical protein n=1 Tax=Streptosporangium sp. NPDC023963 TaxID=3155608 RepID=UPI00343950DB
MAGVPTPKPSDIAFPIGGPALQPTVNRSRCSLVNVTGAVASRRQYRQEGNNIYRVDLVKLRFWPPEKDSQ